MGECECDAMRYGKERKGKEGDKAKDMVREYGSGD